MLGLQFPRRNIESDLNPSRNLRKSAPCERIVLENLLGPTEPVLVYSHILNPQIDLKVLTFLGLAIGVASGLISQLTRTSEDVKDTNKKRLTPFGKLALAVSIVGFAGSFASEIFKNAIETTETADRKRREEDERLWEERSTKLSAEILKNTKKALTDGLEIRFQVQDSKQKVIADNVGRTRKVLESIWAEGHRVSPGDIRVQIRYSFLSEFSDKSPPPQKVFENNPRLSIRAQTAAKAQRLIPNEWKSDHIIGPKEADLSLVADEPAIAQTFLATDGEPSIGQINDFSQFRGEVGPLGSALEWNGATVEIHLTGTSPELRGRVLLRSSRKDSRDLKLEVDALKREYDLTQVLKLIDHADYRIEPLPIIAEATLFIHGKPVAKSIATLVFTTEWDADVRSLVVAKFPLMTIGKGSFVSPFGRARSEASSNLAHH